MKHFLPIHNINMGVIICNTLQHCKFQSNWSLLCQETYRYPILRSSISRKVTKTGRFVPVNVIIVLPERRISCLNHRKFNLISSICSVYIGAWCINSCQIMHTRWRNAWIMKLYFCTLFWGRCGGPLHLNTFQRIEPRHFCLMRPNTHFVLFHLSITDYGASCRFK